MGEVPIMGSAAMEPMYQRFLPGLSVEDRRDSAISPLFADLVGMPPALFSIGTLDPLLDDSLFMAARWAAAGNHAELAVYPESPHGFTLLPTAMARACVQRQRDFVAAAVAGTLP
jgi:acetyl esterase/lipase